MATGRVSKVKGKVLDIPDAPTIGTATAGAASASVAFTASTKGGPITSYTVLSSPGSVTATGTSSPINVTGLTEGTAYTFTVRANNATGSSEYSAASNSVTPTAYIPSYSLAATYNSSQTHTVSAGKYRIAAFVVGAGANGSAGNSGTTGTNNATTFGGNGGAGGASGRGAVVVDSVTTPGSTFTITIGAGGGNTSFGNLASASANAATNNGTGSTTNTVVNGGNGANQTNSAPGNAGGAGTAGSATISYSLTGIGTVTYQLGSSGGGGGSGGNFYAGGGNYVFNGGAGGAGGAANGNGGAGGAGGAGGNLSYNGNSITSSQNVGATGSSGSQPGAGGGGGGGGGAGINGARVGGSGGTGGSGRIYVYEG